MKKNRLILAAASLPVAAGKRRKDLVSRATALLTDGQHEMTLQLWGDMASDEAVTILREGSVAASMGARDGAMRKPAVFELTRLQPSFSFSCEALVLNGKSGSVRRMDSDSAEAISVSASVLAAAAAATAGAVDPPAAAVGAATGSAEQDEETNWRVGAAKSPNATESGRFVKREGGPAATRKFESVAALLSADGFSGAGYLTSVVVRKVDVPSLPDPGTVPITPSYGGGGGPGSSRFPPPSRSGVDPPLTLYLSDPDEAGPEGTSPSAGVDAAVLRVTVGGAPRGELLGCVPEELLLPPLTSGHAGADAVAHAGRAVVNSLLDGLVVGGERVDVVLACSASLDANERVIPGGSVYRLVSLEPTYLSGEMDDAHGV